MKKIILATATSACILASATTHANEKNTDNVDVIVGAGTQGIGFEVISPNVYKNLNFSIQGNYYEHNEDDYEVDGINYDGEVEFKTLGLLANYHPFSGSFHLTAGAYYNDNDVAFAPDEGYLIDNGYEGDGEITFDKFSPYAGVGWNWGEKIIASLDVGVMFHGTPEVDLEANCGADVICQTTIDNYENDIQDEVDDYSYYPVVRFGLGF